MTFRRALFGFSLWFSLAFLFNLCFWRYLSFQENPLATREALTFLTGYLLELSLSADNLFVFLVIFQYFRVPESYQRRVLVWGLLGAIVMRLIFILAGVWVIGLFHWLLYVLGALLIFIGLKLLRHQNQVTDYSQSKLLIFLQRHLRLTPSIEGPDFFIRHQGLLYATPLFLVLIYIECTDVLFALDSVPAIFSITTDPFIIYTSNIFAILGLRSLYFLFVHLADRFQGLHKGILFILIFIGLKMVSSYWFEIPTWATLSVILMILSGAVLGSWHSKPK